VATFSIVAFDPETGDLGVAVESKFLGVGAVVPWARAGVGAVATQAWANTTYGPVGLDLLERGLPPEQVVGILTGRDAGREFRQVGMVDARGRAAAFTGEEANAWAGHVIGDGFACQGNILVGEEVVREMARAFRESKEPLPERLVAALRAGQAAGGDKRGRQSAALLVVREGGGYSGFNDRYIDLHVEDHATPIEELARVLALHRETFGVPPVPGERDAFVVEPPPEKEDLASPRGAFEAFARRFRARDIERLYELQNSAFRDRVSLEEYREQIERSAEGIESFLSRAKYAGTHIEGEEARIALSMAGAPRPHVITLVWERGRWCFPD
jgi:uncharacterized Ntn-hydrolase superfamily protein